jgi:hypothetical protein
MEHDSLQRYLLFLFKVSAGGKTILVEPFFGRPSCALAESPVIKKEEGKTAAQKRLHEIEPVRDVPRISMKMEDDRAVPFGRKKPSVQPFAVFCVEKDFTVLKTKFLGTKIKLGLREVNEETLDSGIEKIEGSGQDHDKSNQVNPVDRHEQHLPKRFFFSHGPIIADPYLSIKRIKVKSFILDGLVKSLKSSFSVIPAGAGIQSF